MFKVTRTFVTLPIGVAKLIMLCKPTAEPSGMVAFTTATFVTPTTTVTSNPQVALFP